MVVVSLFIVMVNSPVAFVLTVIVKFSAGVMSFAPVMVVSVATLLIVMLFSVTSPVDGLMLVITYFPADLLISNVATPSAFTFTEY